MLDTRLHPINQYRRVSVTPILLPRTIFWPNCDACRSTPPSLSFAKEPRLARAILPPSILHARGLLSTYSNKSIWPSAPASFELFVFAHRPHVNDRFVTEDQGVPVRPLDTQILVSHITAPAGPLNCLHI